MVCVHLSLTGRHVGAIQGFPGDPDAPLVCIANSGTIRAGLAGGDVTYGDVTTVLPFGNYIEVVSATGAQI